MDYAPYVLFRENNTTHYLQYLRRGEDNRLIPTASLSEAIRFETARLAYEFGADNRLSWWKVGKRG
jgi:hypothetical protein